MTTFLQTLMDAISVGSLYALIALGYTMVYGVLRFINFAHGDVFMLGAWFSFWVTTKFGWAGEGAHPSIPRALTVMAIAMALCGLLGYLIERLAYRPLRFAPRLNVLITAIGVSLLLQNTGQLKYVFGTENQRMPTLLPATTLATVAGVNITLIDVIIVAGSLVLMGVLDRLVYRSRMGMAMRAVAFDPHTASLMGVNVNRTVSATFVAGSMLAAAAGFLYATKYPNLNQPAFSTWTLLGLKAFIAAVVGGIGNIRGAMVGGLLIGLIEQFGVAYSAPLSHGYITGEFKEIYVFALLILVLLVKPSGILGRLTVEKV
ncbi:MAG: branched-chain amino acid ABC transporter permease [Planctomycetes bacterium]|nr:branched-chain amino acid ABC transporter permease [Planctomycetota bacterium]